MIDSGTVGAFGGIRFCDDDEDAGKLYQIEKSVLGGRGAQHIYPDFDLRVRIRHRQMDVPHRDPGVIRGCQLTKGHCSHRREKTKPSHVTESLITYPEPILNRFKPTSSRQQIKESPSLSLLAEAGLQHIDKSMDYQLNTIKKAPEDSNLERQKAYFAPAYQGRKVYPFGKVFVAEVLRDQVDTQEELNKFTEILEQGVCLYRKKLNKSGLKVYKTSSIAADAILKVIHGQKRVVCSAQRIDVETPTGEILTDKVVYVPEIVGSKVKLKINIKK